MSVLRTVKAWRPRAGATPNSQPTAAMSRDLTGPPGEAVIGRGSKAEVGDSGQVRAGRRGAFRRLGERGDGSLGRVWWDRFLPMLGAVVGGLLLAASMPPVGAWPLALAGIVVLDRSIAGAPIWARFRRGWLAGTALLGPTTWWMREMTLPGWILATLLLGALLGAAVAATPPQAGRWVALPGTWMLFEGVRGRWPFGGVPLSTLAIGQVGGPFAPAARVGGSLVLGAVTVGAAVAIAALLRRRGWAALVAAVAVALPLVLSAVAPHGNGSGRWLDVDLVQGGGPQGTRAIDTDERDVVERHLEASRAVRQDADLVVWPEDVVNVEGPLESQREGGELLALSRRLTGVFVAGVIEGHGDGFTNEAVAFAAGNVVDRVGKERRVPFGEYVPFRSLIEPLAPAALPRRDAIVGRGPSVLDTPSGRLGVMISWEVFFPDRARDAIRDGGQLLLNPTNGSSFTGTQVQTQQVASSRLRAIETGRWVLQVAPTGFSAVIAPDGRLLQRTGVSERKVLHAAVELRTGRTWAVALADWLALGAALALVAGGWSVALRSGRRVDQERA